MLASGNGTRQQCASNLAKTVRGEVPFERMKGVNRSLFDAPATDKNVIKADISWLMNTYEPRINRATVTVSNRDAEGGAFGIGLKIE